MPEGIEIVGCSPMHPNCTLEYIDEMNRVSDETDAKYCCHCHRSLKSGDHVMTHAVGVIHTDCESEVNEVMQMPITPDRMPWTDVLYTCLLYTSDAADE